MQGISASPPVCLRLSMAMDTFADLGGWIAQGRIKWEDHLVKGSKKLRRAATIVPW